MRTAHPVRLVVQARARREDARERVVPSSPTVCYGALDPPVGGTFHFEILVTAPLAKTCPKMVLSHKGGSLCVKDAFAKKPASLVRPGHAQASAILDDASPRTSGHSGLCDAAARSAPR